MFGSVKPFKPELKVAEFDTYKAVYCTLCKRIGKKYGHLFRATLSYDFAFLVLVGLALQEEPNEYVCKRCVYNPFKKCSYCVSHLDVVDRVAAMSVRMLYEKMSDNVMDETGIRRLGSRILRAMMKRGYRRAGQDEPEAAAILSELTKRQRSAERSDCTPEEAAEPTAWALGELCRLLSVTEVDSAHLFRMGYCLGKWAYLADALTDREDDAKKGRFNPLIGKSTDDVLPLLNVSANEAGEAFDRLPALYYNGIVRNILYLGLPHEIERIIRQKEERHEGSL